MTALQLLGYGLYVPFGENTRCDLIMEREGELSRVQCKTGRLRKGAVVFALCSHYGHYGHYANPKAVRRTYHGEIDFFAVYCPETNGVYLLPIEMCPARGKRGSVSTRLGTSRTSGSGRPAATRSRR
jgi:hypothetical protein